MDEVLGGAGGVDADDRGQRLVVDPDPVERVLGDVAVVGDHEGDGLTDVVDLVATASACWVRPWVSVGCGISRGNGSAIAPGQVVVGPDQVHAVEVEHLVDLDVDDPRVGVRRAEHGGVQGAGVRTGEHVVDVPSLSAQQPLVLDAGHLGAEQLGGHAGSATISAARSTEATMFW